MFTHVRHRLFPHAAPPYPRYPLDTARSFPYAHQVKGVMYVYKTELIRRVARETRLTQRVVADVLGGTQRLIEDTLRAGQRVTIPGFGTFYTRKRPAGRVKHIQTGKLINVPARTVAAFRVGAILKRAVTHQRKKAGRRPTRP